MSKIQEMMSKHVIIDIDEHIHVVDGKVIYDSLDGPETKRIKNR